MNNPTRARMARFRHHGPKFGLEQVVLDFTDGAGAFGLRGFIVLVFGFDSLSSGAARRSRLRYDDTAINRSGA